MSALASGCPFCDLEIRAGEIPVHEPPLEIREAAVTIAMLCREIGPAGIERLIAMACTHCAATVTIGHLSPGSDA